MEGVTSGLVYTSLQRTPSAKDVYRQLKKLWLRTTPNIRAQYLMDYDMVSQTTTPLHNPKQSNRIFY